MVINFISNADILPSFNCIHTISFQCHSAFKTFILKSIEIIINYIYPKLKSSSIPTMIDR